MESYCREHRKRGIANGRKGGRIIMKLQKFILTILIGLFSTAAYAQSQSDYEIQQNFKEKYTNYQQQLEDVSSPDSAEKLISKIKEFDQKYSEHEELLNKALYPDSYDEQVEELKKSSVRTLDRVETIAKQNNQLEELETQVASYEENLGQLNEQTDSLKTAIEKSTKSERELSNMLTEYRQSLEKRDELILTFIDSMIVTYQDMDLDALEDIENYEDRSRIESNDALNLIHDISDENIRILESNSNSLELDDYMRMAEVNYQFEQMWNRLGDKIRDVYDGNNADMLTENIDSNMEQWNNLLTTNTLNKIEDIFAENNISVDSFGTSDEFYSSLNSYLDTKITESEEDRSQEGFDELQNFKEFWDRIEIEWGNSLVYADVLEKEQMATIDEKVDHWTQIAEPRANNILVYLLGASVLLAVALGVMLIREKQNKRSA